MYHIHILLLLVVFFILFNYIQYFHDPRQFQGSLWSRYSWSWHFPIILELFTFPLSALSFHLPSLIHLFIKPINIYRVPCAISSTHMILMTTYMLMSLIYLKSLKSLILAKISSLKFQRTRLPRGPFVLKVPPSCFTLCIYKNEGIHWGSCD